jgi:uncharacterized membrane protein YphA (DoxX/SURF4 family)
LHHRSAGTEFPIRVAVTSSLRPTPAPLLYYIMRVAAAMCFIGHGAFGIITKKVWLNYFAVFGIGHDLAWHLMPLVGTADILFGISLIVCPTRAVFGWLVVWGFTTALLRPLSGEPIAETLERAGNYGVPLAMLVMCGWSRPSLRWLRRIEPPTELDADRLAFTRACLRAVVFLLLVGHGWLNLLAKPSLLDQYTGLGFGDPMQVAHTVGLLEVVAAVGVLVRPVRFVLVALLAWKMASELLYPRYEIFEWIERGGSYGAILALWWALPRKPALSRPEPFTVAV